MGKTLVRFSLLALLMPPIVTPVTGHAQRTAPAPEVRIPGLIDASPGARREVINAPASVKSGENFQVTITTTGGGCERAGDAAVILGESDATIIVSDFTVATRPNVACTMIYKRMPHIATLRFTKPGEAVIRVWGRRVGNDTTHFGLPVVIEQKITVR